MIDRIREDIEQRLDQLLAEADKLRNALTALGPRDDNGQATTRRPAGSPRRAGAGGGATRQSTGSAASGQAAPGRGRRQRTASARSGGAAAVDGADHASTRTRTRTASGGTRSAVLDALAKAGGRPLTAGEVASTTGLGRPSVSTTLSKLARSGHVIKAERGYAVATGAESPSRSGR
jgi:DNA-binding transcriptional ArsR family regulator